MQEQPNAQPQDRPQAAPKGQPQTAPQVETPAPVQDNLGRALRRWLDVRRLGPLARRAVACVRGRGWQALGRAVAFRLRLALHLDTWRHRADLPLARELRAQRRAAASLPAQPKISILVPVWNVPPRLFDAMVQSVRRQTYPHWELVLADATGAPNAVPKTDPAGADAVAAAPGATPAATAASGGEKAGTTAPGAASVAATGAAADEKTDLASLDDTAYAAAAAALPPSPLAKRVARLRDKRIVYRRLAFNEGIAGNTNRALQAASGDWLALLDNDDLLYPNALYEVARAVGQGADFVYSDEIVLSADLKKLVQYHFKPDFCPEQLQGCNYITHLSAFSRTLLQQAGGGERAAYNGAQDYDLILRLTEQARHIVHIPRVLYVWRAAAGSTAADISAKPYAIAAGAAALEAHFERIGWPATVEHQPRYPGSYRATITLRERPLVSVLIPSKDHADDLARCLNSLYTHAGYPALEVLVLENNSTDAATFAFYKEAEEKYSDLRVLTWQGPFNFAAINNFGAAAAKGAFLLLLNNDIEITSPGFVRELVSYGQQPGVGAVGAKLLYPDGTIQHAGVILGIGGTAGHSHKGLPGENGGDLNRVATTQNYSAVTGACLLTPADLYRRLGGLDEARFAVAFNDVDYCLRLGQAGARCVYTPYAVATHYESKSRGYDTAGANLARFEKERAAFLARWGAQIAAGDPCYNPHFTYLTENYAYR